MPGRSFGQRTVLGRRPLLLFGAGMLACGWMIPGPQARPASADVAPAPGEGRGPAPGYQQIRESTWAWVRGQLGTGTPVSTPSVITPAHDYPPDWTGPVTGTVTVHDLPAGLDPADLVVHALVVTDRAYPIATTSLGTDMSFSFGFSHPGAKVFRVIDPTTGTVLAESAPSTGLLRSFDAAPEDHLHGRAFSYDQALGLICATALEDAATARVLAQGLIRLQSGGGQQAGGFITSAAALNPEAGWAEYRTGNHAFATYGLLRHLATLADGDPWRAQVELAAERGVDWLLAQQVTGGPLDGLVRGGHGRFADGGFDQDWVVPWASTEHNVDTWHTLRLADSVLSRPDASSAAEHLAQAVIDRLWIGDSATGRFLQGRSPEGPDTDEALDINSWGSLFLQASGRAEMAQTAFERTVLFASRHPPVSGYAPRPGPQPPLVWTEGTCGVALAALRLGEGADAEQTVQALIPAGSPDGAWPGASRTDETMAMTSMSAVGAATWIILILQALDGGPSLWDPPP